ncbi:MAG: YjbE family putative metal transport protein [Alphaproteobacteria bacterium]|nr:YjbE family putative metal transport protein [Alphaproteobacteria bacterium]
MGPLSAEWLYPFFQVVIIDLTLAGDNAVVIGLAAAGLPARQRIRAIIIGIAAATVLRIGFSVVTAELMNVVGLVLAGGILLLWVAWKLWREIHAAQIEEKLSDGAGAPAREKSLFQAVIQIILADVSMSLDNVLAVAGAAREHPAVLVFGLTLSVLLMGFAAAMIARLLKRHRWIAYIGLGIIVLVAAEMIYQGGREVIEVPAVQSSLAGLVP